MNAGENSSNFGLPTAAKTKKGRLLVLKHSKTVNTIACLLHDFQDFIFILSVVKLLDDFGNFFAIVVNYSSYKFTLHHSAWLHY